MWDYWRRKRKLKPKHTLHFYVYFARWEWENVQTYQFMYRKIYLKYSGNVFESMCIVSKLTISLNKNEKRKIYNLNISFYLPFNRTFTFNFQHILNILLTIIAISKKGWVKKYNGNICRVHVQIKTFPCVWSST